MLKPKHIHHHYVPSVTSTHTPHIISSTAPTLSPLDLWTDPDGVTALLAREAGWWTTSGNIILPPLARPDCANSVGPSVKSDKMMSGPIKVLILPVRSPVNKMTTVYCRV